MTSNPHTTEPRIAFSILTDNASTAEIIVARDADFDKLMRIGDNLLEQYRLSDAITHMHNLMNGKTYSHAASLNAKNALTEAYMKWANQCADENSGTTPMYLSKLMVAHLINVLATSSYRYYYCGNNMKNITLQKLHDNCSASLQCALRACNQTNNKIEKTSAMFLSCVSMLQSPTNNGNKKIELIFKRLIDSNQNISSLAISCFTDAYNMIRVPVRGRVPIPVPIPTPLLYVPTTHRLRSCAMVDRL